MNVGAVKAPTIRRSQTCKRLRQSVSISRKSLFQVHGVRLRDHGHGWRHGAAMQVTFVEGGVETYGILESDDVTSRIDERAKAVT